MIEHGEFPTESKDGKYVASTPRLYVNALIRLLGKLQKHLSDWQPESLPDGRLHLRQFFAFRTPQFLYLPNIIDMLETFMSPGVKGQALEGYIYLVKAVLR